MVKPKGSKNRYSKRPRGNLASLIKAREARWKNSTNSTAETPQHDVADAAATFPSPLAATQPTTQESSSFTPEDTAGRPIPPFDGSVVETVQVEGRRIVDLMAFIEKLKNLCNHAPFSCTFSDMDVMKFTDKGLNFSIWFKCKMCNQVDRVDSSDDDGSDVSLDTWAVSSALAAGIGHKQLSTVLGGMNIPCFSDRMFIKQQDIVYSGWQASAEQLMAEAAEEEKAAAIERGDVDPRDGVPLIRVIADGCWSKRSYRTGYSAHSGVGAIIGYHTRKVLFIGAKNKYCVICARAANAGNKAKEHVCYKNWDQSSSSMEAAIITEGFVQSEEMYGLRYTTLVADGDSNVYSSIVAAHPYLHNPVEKIECRNHLMRNFIAKMKAVGESKGVYGVYRQLVKSNLLRMRKGILSAVKYRSSNDRDVQLLRKDILNCASHVFGDHSDCAEYFCKSKNESIPEIVVNMRQQPVWHEIMKVLNTFAEHSKSLMHNVDSNPAEIYNNVIAKFVGGKRTNLIQRQSYAGRAHIAVVSLNSVGKPMYNLSKTLTDKSPGVYCKKVEESVHRKLLQSKKKRLSGLKICRKKLFTETNTKGYGPNCEQLDATPEMLNERKKQHMNELLRLQSQRVTIEQETREQRDSILWTSTRRMLLTASNFGRVCTRRKTTSCKNIVKDIIYGGNFTSAAMMYGQKYEDLARSQLAMTIGEIQKCGLFISEKFTFLGASPDGLIGEDGVVEIKCPSSCANITIEEGLELKKITYWRKNNKQEWEFNRKHLYFYQIQGQLAITDREYCMFFAWTPKGPKLEKIYRDRVFWETKMLPTLEKFYHDCLLPEIVDPRVSRNMPIREAPDFEERQNKENIPALGQ